MCLGTICQCNGGAAYNNQLSNQYNGGYLLQQLQQNHYNREMEKFSYERLNSILGNMGIKAPNKLVLDPNSTNRKMPKITSNTYVGVSATTGAIVSVDKDLTVVKREAAQAAHKEEGAVIVFKPVFQVEPKRDVVETEITL